MPFDPKGVATQLVNEKLGGAGEEQGEQESVNTMHEMWRDLIDAIHAEDHVAAANIHEGIFRQLESEPHDEYEEEAEEDDGYSSGGVAMGGGKLSGFKNPAGAKLPGRI